MKPSIGVEDPARIGIDRCNCCGGKAEALFSLGWIDGVHASRQSVGMCTACVALAIEVLSEWLTSREKTA